MKNTEVDIMFVYEQNKMRFIGWIDNRHIAAGDGYIEVDREATMTRLSDNAAWQWHELKADIQQFIVDRVFDELLKREGIERAEDERCYSRNLNH